MDTEGRTEHTRGTGGGQPRRTFLGGAAALGGALALGTGGTVTAAPASARRRAAGRTVAVLGGGVAG